VVQWIFATRLAVASTATRIHAAFATSVLLLPSTEGEDEYILPPYSMDGPNYEKLFTGMQCLKGSNPEDAKMIVRWLRFYQGTEGYELYLNHYLPQLPEDLAKEFKVEQVETVTTTITVEPEEKVVTSTDTVSISPKKRSPKK